VWHSTTYQVQSCTHTNIVLSCQKFSDNTSHTPSFTPCINPPKSFVSNNAKILHIHRSLLKKLIKTYMALGTNNKPMKKTQFLKLHKIKEDTFDDSKWESPTTIQESKPIKHKLNANKNCKIENTLFWNFKSSKVIWNYRTWDYNPYTKYLKSGSYWN
jgi:hypothetical protein